MKHIKIVLILVVTLLIFGCNPCRRLQRLCPQKDSISYVETVTENPYYLMPDTFYYDLLFECDSHYAVIIKNIEEANSGTHTETVFKEVIRYKEDKTKVMQLRVSLRAITDSILVRDKLIEKLKSEVKTVYVDKDKIVYKSRKLFVYSFFILLGIILLSIGWIYLKYKAKILGLFK